VQLGKRTCTREPPQSGQNGHAREGRLTSIDLASDDHFRLPDSGFNGGAILGVVVDDHVFPAFDEVTGRAGPFVGDQGEGFEFIAWDCEIALREGKRRYPRSS